MIEGIGTDLVEIERIARVLERHGQKFLSRVFTKNEQRYCSQYGKKCAERYAGRFAAKEAVSKAIGTGIGAHLSWLDIEILPGPTGKPIATCKNRRIVLSLSHSKTFATATAVVLRKRVAQRVWDWVARHLFT